MNYYQPHSATPWYCCMDIVDWIVFQHLDKVGDTHTVINSDACPASPGSCACHTPWACVLQPHWPFSAWNTSQESSHILWLLSGMFFPFPFTWLTPIQTTASNTRITCSDAFPDRHSKLGYGALAHSSFLSSLLPRFILKCLSACLFMTSFIPSQGRKHLFCPQNSHIRLTWYSFQRWVLLMSLPCKCLQLHPWEMESLWTLNHEPWLSQ